MRFDIAPGYYLYRERFIFAPAPGETFQLAAPALPPGEVKHDEYFGEVEVYYGQVERALAVQSAGALARQLRVDVTYQGCADAGLCYPRSRRPSPSTSTPPFPPRVPAPRPPSTTRPEKGSCHRRTGRRARSRPAAFPPSWPSSRSSACCSRSLPACCRWFRSCPRSSSGREGRRRAPRGPSPFLSSTFSRWPSPTAGPECSRGSRARDCRHSSSTPRSSWRSAGSSSSSPCRCSASTACRCRRRGRAGSPGSRAGNEAEPGWGSRRWECCRRSSWVPASRRRSPARSSTSPAPATRSSEGWRCSRWRWAWECPCSSPAPPRAVSLRRPARG